MIETRDAHSLHEYVNATLRRLSQHERDQLAERALVLAEVRIHTLNRDYYYKALDLLHTAAPSLASELHNLMETVDDLYRKIGS